LLLNAPSFNSVLYGPPKVSITAVVGQDKHPLPLVRRADFRRAEYSPRRCITIFFQVGKDCGESKRNVSLDVFEPDPRRSNGSDELSAVGPEVSVVVNSESFPGMAEPLAGIGSDEEIKLLITERFCGEVSNIRPDRYAVQESLFHFADHVRNDEGVPLTDSDRAQAWDCSSKSESISTVAVEPFNTGNFRFFGNIHIIFLHMFLD
jgi:hypothetical protein